MRLESGEGGYKTRHSFVPERSPSPSQKQTLQRAHQFSTDYSLSYQAILQANPKQTDKTQHHTVCHLHEHRLPHPPPPTPLSHSTSGTKSPTSASRRASGTTASDRPRDPTKASVACRHSTSPTVTTALLAPPTAGPRKFICR